MYAFRDKSPSPPRESGAMVVYPRVTEWRERDRDSSDSDFPGAGQQQGVVVAESEGLDFDLQKEVYGDDEGDEGDDDEAADDDNEADDNEAVD